MENTLENATAFLDELSDAFPKMRFSQAMVEYAASVRPVVVLPSRLDIVEYFKDTNFPDFYRGGAHWMYDEIRRLNPELKFIESK